MRFIAFILSLSLFGCVNTPNSENKLALVLHCPAFNNASWTKTSIPQSQQTMFINKQKFAVPPDYQTLWFKSKSNSIGLCIIPDKRNRGSGYGCSSAYVIYAKAQESWQLKDQKVAICSN